MSGQGDSNRVKVGGWLLVLCIVLVFVRPTATVIGAVSDYRFAGRFSDQLPRLQTLMPLQIVIAFLMSLWSIGTGAELWMVEAGAVRRAKEFLVAALIVDAASAWIPFAAGFPDTAWMELGAGALEAIALAVAFTGVWLGYLVRSKRVAAVYGPIDAQFEESSRQAERLGTTRSSREESGPGSDVSVLPLHRGQEESDEGRSVANLPRPKAVTVAGWFVIVATVLAYLGAMGTAAYLVIAARTDPRVVLRTHRLVLFVLVPSVSSGVQIAAGIGILRGKRWARNLFLWWVPATIAFSLTPLGNGLHTGLLVKAAWYAVVAIVVTRPQAARYFGGSLDT